MILKTRITLSYSFLFSLILANQWLDGQNGPVYVLIFALIDLQFYSFIALQQSKILELFLGRNAETKNSLSMSKDSLNDFELLILKKYGTFMSIH